MEGICRRNTFGGSCARLDKGLPLWMHAVAAGPFVHKPVVG